MLILCAGPIILIDEYDHLFKYHTDKVILISFNPKFKLRGKMGKKKKKNSYICFLFELQCDPVPFQSIPVPAGLLLVQFNRVSAFLSSLLQSRV